MSGGIAWPRVVFGRYQSNVARDVLDTILNIQPKDSGGGGETRETVVYRLAEEFLGKLPRNYVDFEVSSADFCVALERVHLASVSRWLQTGQSRNCRTQRSLYPYFCEV